VNEFSTLIGGLYREEIFDKCPRLPFMVVGRRGIKILFGP
jgi:hypothetical protein